MATSMAIVAAVALAAGYGTWHSSVGENLELQTIDARFQVRGVERAWPGVVVVGIDPNTLLSLGRFPFSRTYDAEIIDRLRADGARTIAFDLVFDSATSPRADLALYNAVARDRGHVVLAADATATNGSGATAVLGGLANQRRAGVSIGNADFEVASDGAIRQVAAEVPPTRGGIPSFAAATALEAGLSPFELHSDFSGNSQWIDSPGPPGTVTHYTFIQVLAGHVNPALLRGRIVVVGATDPDLQDQHAVGGWSEPMSGPELEADAIATLMTGAPLRSAPGAVNWLLLIVAATLLPALAWRRVRWPRVVAVGLLVLAALVVGTQLAFNSGTISLFVPVFAALFVSGVGAVLVPLSLERRELAALRRRFARFDPAVVDAVLSDPGIALRARALAIGPESVIAGYRIVSLVGQGGMGVVYEALQLILERPVALKLINPERINDDETRARFVRESHVAAGLEHPHVLPVYEAREDGGLLFIAMRLVRGPSLADVLAREAPLAPAYAARLVAQIASALSAAHARGLVHRDVKPANILLHEREHAYLTDFGVTRELGEDGLTTAGELLGSVDYMAPEQSRGERVGPAADIYSLGCVLYEALTAQVPYPGPTDGARIAAHLTEPTPRASARWPSVPASLDEVIIRALHKEPGKRYISAAAFASALAAAVGLERVAEPLEPRRAPATIDQPTLAGSG